MPGLGAEILAPGNSKLKFPAWNSGPFTESCTTARDKGLSEKSRGPEILEFLAPGNSRISSPRKFYLNRISGPLPESCTTVLWKGLSQIFEGQKLWNFTASEILPDQNFWPLTEPCTTMFCKGLSWILKGQKLWNFWPLEILSRGENSSPGAEFLALKHNFRPWYFLSSGWFQAFLQ
jgi:hypothetical protein